MGLAIAFVYIPIYIVISILSILIGMKIIKKYKGKGFFIVAGFALGLLFTLFLVWLVPVLGHKSWDKFIYQAASTLFAPSGLAVLLAMFLAVMPESSKALIGPVLAGVLFSSIFAPWATFVASTNYNKYKNSQALTPLCEKAELKVVEQVSTAKSVAFLQDSFTAFIEHQGFQSGPQAHFILRKSVLEYVEMPNRDYRINQNNSEYLQVRTVGKRYRDKTYDLDNRIKYETIPIDDLTAEYEVHSKYLELPEERKRGIGGTRVEIRRSSDSKLIAYTQYYWDRTENKACPEGAMDRHFIYKFITNSLKIDHTDNKF